VQLNGGQRLRALRETLISMRTSSHVDQMRQIWRMRNTRFRPPLSDIETKASIPNIVRLYSFAAIYRRAEYRELLPFYGLNWTAFLDRRCFAQPQKSHVAPAVSVRH